MTFEDDIRLMVERAVDEFLARDAKAKRYVVIRSRDGKRFSLPAEYRIAEGVRDYLESHTNSRFSIHEVGHEGPGAKPERNPNDD